ncbi:MAG: hypothetical protein J7K36_03295 [Archaeoglobaceae archaeon]|nr:hypothetical protein [Archaeoglobaceae archaeon]
MKIYVLLAILILCITASSAKGIYADSYKSIQEAINAAKDGDTVYVKGGIYNESISISKSIKLIGSHDGNETILNGMRVSTAINVFADNVKLQALQF